MQLLPKSARHGFAHALSAACCTLLVCWSSNIMAAPAPAISISQVPLTVTIPAHPQILLALANSESMDGDLSGAIRTGSGSIAQPLLYNSASPVNFTIPTGFTPPLNPGTGIVAPYTVNSGGHLVDNSPSRLNVAKAGLSAVLNAYIPSADFGLIDYDTSGLTAFTTWVYQMSNPGGFTFTNTIPPSGEYVLNPCFAYTAALPTTAAQDCVALNAYYPTQNIAAQQYMLVSFSSDDPSVNDVLYAGGFAPICIVYNGPHPAPNPFPPQFSLGNYENGGVFESYSSEVNGCAGTTGPTNAGFVPYSSEVMYELRGFGYYTFGETANDGNTVVPMTSSGAVPTPTSVANAVAQFTPFLAPETNSTGTSELKAAATQSPIAGLLHRAQTLFAGNPPTTNGCASQRYVVLITDGLPTMDLAHHNWPPLGSLAAQGDGGVTTNGYGVTATFDPVDQHLISTNDQALTDVINKLTALQAAGINTYIIGLGAGVDPSVNTTAANTLSAMSFAGGTRSASPNGYFPATSPQDVTNDLQIIITTILAQTQSTASAAVNSTGLNVNSKVYQSQFVTSDTPYQDWTGNLFQYPIDPTTGVVNIAAPDWSAQTQMDLAFNPPSPATPAPRLISTWDPTQNKAIPFEWTPGNPPNGIGNLTPLGTPLQTFTSDPNGSDVLQFLRGSTAQSVKGSPGGPFRNRSHILGDIVDSNPAYIGPSNEGIQSTSYIAYAASTNTRAPVLYIGADDGMLHAFDVGTGNELFSYIPRGVYNNLVNLVSPYYNAQHLFYVNGSPQAADVQFTDLTWHSILVGTEAQGGKSVYALDITNPSAITSEATLSSSVLWDFVDPDMGLGFSTPAIANTAAGWKVFFGNGYNSTNQKPFLFVLDPQTGSTVGTPKIDLCAAVPTACDLTTANGLSSVAAVNSGGQVAGGANLIYAGDLQGNLWRVDISNANPALWAVSVLFQARDASGNKQPITTVPVVSLNPRFPQVLGTMVMFGTGQFLGVSDIANPNVQSIYGVYDPPAGYVTPLLRSNLLPQTLATANIGALQVRTISGTAPIVPANKGWYIDLNLLTGERVINDPRLEAGGELVLTTYQPIPPSVGSCVTGGSAYLMVLNFATGGSFTSPQFDANGDGKIDSSDTVVPPLGVTPVAPVGMSLGNVYASAPTIRSGSFTTGTGIALITESGVGSSAVDPTIKPVILKGPSKSRTAWWEIRQ